MDQTKDSCNRNNKLKSEITILSCVLAARANSRRAPFQCSRSPRLHRRDDWRSRPPCRSSPHSTGTCPGTSECLCPSCCRSPRCSPSTHASPRSPWRHSFSIACRGAASTASWSGFSRPSLRIGHAHFEFCFRSAAAPWVLTCWPASYSLSASRFGSRYSRILRPLPHSSRWVCWNSCTQCWGWS